MVKALRKTKLKLNYFYSKIKESLIYFYNKIVLLNLIYNKNLFRKSN